MFRPQITVQQPDQPLVSWLGKSSNFRLRAGGKEAIYYIADQVIYFCLWSGMPNSSLSADFLPKSMSIPQTDPSCLRICRRAWASLLLQEMASNPSGSGKAWAAMGYQSFFMADGPKHQTTWIVFGSPFWTKLFTPTLQLRRPLTSRLAACVFGLEPWNTPALL